MDQRPVTDKPAVALTVEQIVERAALAAVAELSARAPSVLLESAPPQQD